MKHVTLNFGTVKVPAMEYNLFEKDWTYWVDTLNATTLVEHLAGQQLVDIATIGRIVILNNKGTFLKATEHGYLVTVVAADMRTEASMISEKDYESLNAFVQCHIDKRKCPIEKLNSLPGNPSPQRLSIISFGQRLDGDWGKTGRMDGLSPGDIVRQIVNHNLRRQAYEIVCDGTNGRPVGW